MNVVNALKKVSVFALLIALLAGCGGTQPTQPAEQPKSEPKTEAPAAPKPVNLVVAQGADAVTLDPHKTNDQPSSRVMRQIYDTLVEQTEKLELVPSLATSWEQKGETTWEFKLRQGVKFHNGETFTAKDVKFTFDRLLNPATKAPGAFILGQVKEVKVVDDYTVQIELKTSFAPILAHLSHTATSILNEKAVTAGGEDYGKKPVGTGPFTFKDWKTGESIDLVRNDGYWGNKAGADTIRFRVIKEDATRAIELETGAVDIAYGVAPQEYERLKADNKVVLDRSATLSTNYIGFNVSKAPLDKVEVRQAINHAINVDEIIQHILLNVGRKATGPISSLVWGANPNLKGYEYNPDKSKELLAKAGLASGFKTTLWTNDNPIRMKIAEVVQSQLGKIGIQVEVQVIEWGQYLKDTADGKHDMFILGWGTVTGDADYGLFPLFHSSQVGSPGNRTFYKNAEVDKLLEQGRTSGDPNVRRDAYYKAQELITKDAPWLFLNIGEEITGLGKSVKGFVAHPTGSHRLAGVTKQ